MRNKWMLRIKPIAAFLLCFAMVLTFGGCKKDDPSVDKTSMTIAGADDAITQLAEAEADYGYENALSELTEISTSSINGDSYYRLQQNYQGIPVYGRTVVCATDKDGNVTSVIGNVQDIDPNINLTPSITSVQAQESIRVYVTDVLEQEVLDIVSSEPITCIYDRTKLAYIYTITTEGNFFVTHEALVDAHDAGILEWNTYTASFDTNQYILEAADVNCEFDDSHNLKLADNRRNHSVHYLDLITSQKYPMVEDVVGNSDFLATAVPDQTASGETHALAHLAQTSDFYADVLGRQSYNNQGAPVYLFSCDADFLTDQGKALANPACGVIMLGEPTAKFAEPLGKALDLVAHEYTHLVFQTEVGLSNDLDVTSVSEGIADILGNLIELYVNGEQDTNWPLSEDAGYIKYNMADPITMAAYGNEEHDNAQILSHSAYLMWNGIDGTNSKRLSTAELAELWYRAVLMMPADCDFILCRQLVEVAAQSMETLDDEQCACVREAFDRVGIASTREDTFYADYRLNEDATLTVYDQNNEPYSGYTLRINGTIDTSEIASNMTPDIGWVVNRTNTVEEPGAYALDLPQGRYMLTITDRYYDESYTIYVEINNDYTETDIDLITAFEEPLVVVIPEPDYENLVSDAYTDAIVDGEWVYCYHIPQINLSDSRGEAFNAKIYDKFYELLSTDVYQSIEEYDYPYLSQMVYTWGHKDNLLSIVMQTDQTMYSWTDFYVYTISVDTGEEISYKELLAAYNLSETNFYNLVKETLKEYWHSRKNDMISFVGEDYYNTLVESTIDEENVKNAIPYINSNGELCFVAYVYSAAGAEKYLHLLNTTGTADEGWIKCTINHFPAETHPDVSDETNSPELEPVESNTGGNKDGDLLTILVGTWVRSDAFEFRFFTDGTYEENIVSLYNNILLNRFGILSGPIEIIDDTHAKLWDMGEGPFALSSFYKLEYDPVTDTISVAGSDIIYHRATYAN